MSVHPNGDGEAWVEDVDVDQPHGLDYRYENHIAKAVRLRMEKGHTDFGDTTAGGEHIAGGAGVLGMEITNDAGDPTAAVVSDGTYKGRGLIWMHEDDTSFSVLFCNTAASESTAAVDWTVLAMHPDKQWKGGDVTWQGNHQFDSSVQFYDPVDFTGPLSIDGTVDFSGSVVDFHETVRFSDGTSIIVIADDTLVIDNTTASKGVRADCTWTFTKAVDFTGSSVIMAGNMNIDGGGGAPGLGNLRITSSGELDISTGGKFVMGGGSFDITPAGGTDGPTFGILGDWSSVGYAVNTTYGPVVTDGFIVGYAQNTTNLSMYTDSNAAPVTLRWLSDGAAGKRSTFMCPIKKNDFWCLSHGSGAGDTAIADGTIAWLPIGDNT